MPYYPSDSGSPARRRKILIGPIVIALLILAVQYFSAETFTNPETGSTARVALSTEQEAALGLQSFKEVLSQSKIVSVGPGYDMTMAAATKLIRAVDEGSKDFSWDARLIESEQINAFCLPGGKIAIYTGILPVAKTEAGLAAVMGHEIAHATARHGAQRVFQQNLIQTGMMGLQGAIGDMDNQQKRAILSALGAGVQYGIILPYSRDHEFEADKIGLIYMQRAGYDLDEAVRFWQRMAELSERQPPEWASTHPGHESRIARLKELIPEIKKQNQS